MKRWFCAIPLLMLGFAMNAQAPPAKPNFTGMWKMDVANSDFGGVPAPTRQTEVFTQNGDDFKLAITSERDDIRQNYVLTFKADGVERPTAKDLFPEDAKFKILNVKSEWNGSALVLTEKIVVPGASGALKANYTLSGDGKVMTKAVHLSMEMGELDTKAVYDRQ